MEPSTLHAATERLLSKAEGKLFIQDFTAEWLDLEKLGSSTPNRKLYRKFDPVVQHSMLQETRTFMQWMLNNDESVTGLIAGHFTFVNSRLARYYGIEGVYGDYLRRISLPPHGHRAGVLTHGSIMNVTSNGTNTSPVLRGVWVSERLLGVSIPPPPTNVPAIEPDVRGATSIREQLAMHRSDDSCASCHTKIDPAGFALENFDPTGQWRDAYPKKGNNKSRIRIDASHELADGRQFEDIRAFRKLIAAEPRNLAANVAEHLLVYGTGAPIRFSDRQVVHSIVDAVADDDFGFRSIVHAVIASPIFLNK